MATPTFLTPASFKPPPYGKGDIRYRVKTFAGYEDEALLDADIATFLDSLVLPNAPWPHIVSMHATSDSTGVNVEYTIHLMYLLVSPA